LHGLRLNIASFARQSWPPLQTAFTTHCAKADEKPSCCCKTTKKQPDPDPGPRIGSLIACACIACAIAIYTGAAAIEIALNRIAGSLEHLVEIEEQRDFESIRPIELTEGIMAGRVRVAIFIEPEQSEKLAGIAKKKQRSEGDFHRKIKSPVSLLLTLCCHRPRLRSLRLDSSRHRTKGRAMSCLLCASGNQAEFGGEILIQFKGPQGSGQTLSLGIPKLFVCLDCGSSRFMTPESELALLARGAPASERSVPDPVA
jgi:hypothetical protein